jgi:hypothetical protein
VRKIRLSEVGILIDRIDRHIVNVLTGGGKRDVTLYDVIEEWAKEVKIEIEDDLED